MITVPGAIFTAHHFLHNLRIVPKARVFISGKFFQPIVLYHSSLLVSFLSYKENETVNTVPGAVLTTLYFLRNLRIVPIS